MIDSYSSESFESAFTYTGRDLGAVWSPLKTTFRLWAPTARSAAVNLYQSGTPWVSDKLRQIPMVSDVQGTWVAEIPGNLNGVYYTYSVSFGDKTAEACDPYAKAVGINGIRSMVLNLSETNPAGWHLDQDPHAGCSITDAVIYEVHIRDLTVHARSGIRHKGKFLGVTETDTSTGGRSTGLDHIKELGVTHVQLMPVYDYGSIDEASDKKQYNWGYDPMNFNVPEGSYSTDPYDGACRVAELKHMIKMLHANGLSVVMDVVYNHVYHAEGFCFNKLVPGYFSRPNSNGSGCGNDTASERSMVRKYIIDSLNYWADEYHIDGFRFDLAGLLDAETIRLAMESIRIKHPGCLFYGEGWYMGTQVTKKDVALANQGSAQHLPGFAFFNDTIRDALRGSVFQTDQPGYVTGNFGYKSVLEKSFLGEVDWATCPAQSVNYVSCHDNNTLFDRIALALPGISRQEQIRRNHLAAAFCILSQGIPMMLAGEEMLRTKLNRNGHYISNSYRSPDSVNSIKWNTLKEQDYWDTFSYYRGLIAFRKAFPVLRLSTAFDVKSSVFPVPTASDSLMMFTAYGSDYRLVIAFNADTAAQKITLPRGEWDVLIRENIAGTRPIARMRENVLVPSLSTLALIQRK